MDLRKAIARMVRNSMQQLAHVDAQHQDQLVEALKSSPTQPALADVHPIRTEPEENAQHQEDGTTNIVAAK
jgi:hypothetical protein